VRSKKAEFFNPLISTEPDIILGTETWLKPEKNSSEFFPPTYSVYRHNRTRSRGYGGALVAVKSPLISHEIPTGSTAEAVLVSMKTTKKTEPLIVGSVYRSLSETSIEQMGEILKTIDSIKTDGVVWLGGDLNLPDIDWNNMKITGHHNPTAVNQALIDKVCDRGLYQANTKPTRENKILDLIITNRLGLIIKCTTLPPLSDHDIILVDSKIKAARVKPIARPVSIRKKAKFDSIRTETATFSEFICPDLTVDQMWRAIQGHLTTMI
jgi:hypothetical protein